MGLETEYAIRFQSNAVNRDGNVGERPTDKKLYQRLVNSLHQALPVASSNSAEPSHFLATGGAIKFEQFLQSREVGLVEGATPECRSPRDLLTWQRGQDRLFSQAAAEAGKPDGEFVLIKNNRDSHGNSYGSHENYDVPFATGASIWLWRTYLVVMLPFILLGWLLFIPLTFVSLMLVWTAGGLAYWLTCILISAPQKRPERAAFLGGLSLEEQNNDAAPFPTWFEPIIHLILFVSFAPFFLTIELVIRFLGFRAIRTRSTAFLITRIVLCGSGWLSPEGKFYLSQKATVCNAVVGMGMLRRKPIFNFGNLAETYLMGVISSRRLRSLFQGRQRLQITFGDSNLCEEAEYLRLATTRLVFDAIEAGHCVNPPKISRGIQSLRRLNREGIETSIATFKGQPFDAIAVQRWYLKEVRTFTEGLEDSDEVANILKRWEYALDRLSDQPDSLVGRVDWVTKRFLLNRAGNGLPIESRRMIDLKYHEISPAGYYFQLAETGVAETIVSEEDIQQAMRNPPATRAALRGRYIREFAGTPVPLKIDWDSITIGKGKESRTVMLPRET